MELRHGRVALALRRVREGEGTPLLLLHALHGSSDDWGKGPEGWPGPVCALDFAGHGRSGWVRGGVYYPELLSADADGALAELGTAVLVGAGLGAYVALLLAGARPASVPAAVLLPGAGLAGGGDEPCFDRADPDLGGEPAGQGAASDPYLRACEEDIRPPDYAASFAEAARRLLLVENGSARPGWWQAASSSPSAETASDLASALAKLAGKV
jgi:pimeloyl-ACP methyl ester carboxylesterase